MRTRRGAWVESEQKNKKYSPPPRSNNDNKTIQIADDEAAWLDVVALNAADGPAWAPEVLHYGIADAPAFVLLDTDGRALAQTGPVLREPRGRDGEGEGASAALVSAREAVLTGLDAIIESGRPKGA